VGVTFLGIGAIGHSMVVGHGLLGISWKARTWHLGCRAHIQHVQDTRNTLGITHALASFFFLKNDEQGGDMVGTRPMPKKIKTKLHYLSQHSPPPLVFFFFFSSHANLFFFFSS